MTDNVYVFLSGLTFLFLLIVATYYFNTINKSNIVLRKKYMIGHWQREGTSPSTLEPWKFDYIIDDKNVVMQGKNPDYQAKGVYKILKEEENLISILVENIEGDGDLAPRRMSVAVDKKKEKIYIDGRRFERV